MFNAGQIEPSGQFVSTQVNLFQTRLSLLQPRSTCFNPGQFGVGTKHRSQVIVLPIVRKYLKHSLKLTLGLNRPKQKF